MSYTAALICPIYTEEKIRLGEPYDAGYVVHKATVMAARCLLSFGIGYSWHFERDFQDQNPHVVAHLYDPYMAIGTNWALMRMIKYLLTFRWRKLRSLHKEWDAFRCYLRRHTAHYYKVGIASHYDEEDRAVDFPTLFSTVAAEGPVFVKMDVEGTEWQVLDQLIPYADRIAGLVVEFHDLSTHEDTFTRIIEHFSKAGLHIIHAHGNNAVPLIRNKGLPNILELSFAHRRFLGEEPLRLDKRKYPLAGLDSPCLPQSSEISIDFSKVQPKIWT